MRKVSAQITHHKFYHWVVFFISLLLLSSVQMSCSDSADKEFKENAIAGIKEVQPAEIVSFESAGEYYFDHLGYRTQVLSDGSVLLPDRELQNIMIIDRDQQVKKVFRSGRGPGEVLDAYEPYRWPDDRIAIMDSDNAKLLVIKPDGEFSEEVRVKPKGGNFVVKLYPATGNNYIAELQSYEHIRNPEAEPVSSLIIFNSENFAYGDSLVYKSVPFAPLIVDGDLRGGKMVPFADQVLLGWQPADTTFYLFDNVSGNMSKIDHNLDTLRSFKIDLPTEKVSDAEIDSLRNQRDNKVWREQWKTLGDLLPEIKSPASELRISGKYFWFRSNMKDSDDIWFVATEADGPVLKVRLPENSTLTHIHPEHLGLRLNDQTFALFENPVQ